MRVVEKQKPAVLAGFCFRFLLESQTNYIKILIYKFKVTRICIMPRRIEEDYKDFRDVYSGRRRKALKKFIENGSIFRTRGDGKKIRITIPRINIPRFVFGESGEGVGRGPGKKGDVIGKDPQKSPGKGNKAGQEQGDGIEVDVEMDEVLKFLQEELHLPDLRPKPNQTFEETIIKYNDISKQGPESLRHNRRTWRQSLKRLCASGEIDKLYEIPGYSDPMKLITPINDDRRYRQYTEIQVPSSNAVIFFARDGSGSMDQTKCDIVSDMAWWIDLWIRKFYKRVERMYVWHDTQAEEVDENKFYKYRYGGGTTCSSALKLISKQLENRFTPDKWNVYVFYFTDGENWGGDNKVFCETIKEKLSPNIVNFVGITQILSWIDEGSLKHYVDNAIGQQSVLRLDNLKTTSIISEDKKGYYSTISDEARDLQIKKAIIELLGKDQSRKE